MAYNPKQNGRKSKSNNSKGRGKCHETSRHNTAYERKNLRDELSHERSSGRYQQTEEKLSSLNDISWYSKYPELLAAAANIPFPNRPGMQVKVAEISAEKRLTAKVTIPGVWGINFVPSVGFSDSNMSPISLTAKEWYTAVRRSFSGSLDADAPDFVMYVMALDSISAYIASLKRIFRLTNAYSTDNYGMPVNALRSVGISVEGANALRRDRVKFWQGINTLVHQARKFHLPNVMDIFNRHRWMNENVYTDAPTANSQFYMFHQVGYHKFQLDENGAGMLKAVHTPSLGSDPVTTLLDFGSELIEALNDYDTAYTISGYFGRAFEGTPNVPFDLIELDEVLNPVYQEEVLSQIENCRSINATYDWPGTDITQDPTTNAIIHKPQKLLTTHVNYFTNPILNIHSNTPSPTDVVIATRLHPTRKIIDSKEYIIAGTEIVTGFNIYNQPAFTVTEQWNAETVAQSFNYFGSFYQIEGVQLAGSPNKTVFNENELSKYLNFSSLLEQFDWHPIVLCFISTTCVTSGIETRTTRRVGFHADTYNFTAFTSEALEDLHRVCIFSEFNAFNIA